MYQKQQLQIQSFNYWRPSIFVRSVFLTLFLERLSITNIKFIIKVCNLNVLRTIARINQQSIVNQFFKERKFDKKNLSPLPTSTEISSYKFNLFVIKKKKKKQQERDE